LNSSSFYKEVVSGDLSITTYIHVRVCVFVFQIIFEQIDSNISFSILTKLGAGRPRFYSR